jgi:hypothetical protein
VHNLRVLRPEVSVIDVYITNYSFKSLLLKGGGRKTLRTCVWITSKNSASGSKFKIIEIKYLETIPLKVGRLLAYKYNALKKKSFKEIVLIASFLYIEVR